MLSGQVPGSYDNGALVNVNANIELLLTGRFDLKRDAPSRTAVFIVNDYILCVPYKMIDGHSVKCGKSVNALIGIGPG